MPTKKQESIDIDTAYLDNLVKQNSFYANNDDVKNVIAERKKKKTSTEELRELSEAKPEETTLGELIEDIGNPKAPPPPKRSALDAEVDRLVSNEERRVKRLHERAEREGAADNERVERVRNNIERSRVEAIHKKKRTQEEAIKDVAQQSINNIQARVSDTADRIGAVQTVGGIGLLLVILLILLFAIVRVNANGDTRLKQFWYMLNGRATLQGAVTPNPQASGGMDFGGGAYSWHDYRR